MEENVPDGSICCICQSSDNDEALYGKFYKYQDIITHYFCLLLASKILQRGSDEDGILGFLPNDIINEIKRGKNLVCCFCGKRGATIGCFSPKCRLNFHLPCGRKRDTFHQFFGQFKSFCPKHRLKQKINHQVLKAMSGRKSVNCVICLESVSTTPAPNTLWAPCCSKEAWFHRLCVQRLALSAGYFFKCPLCNNTKQFVEAMRTYGIWVPEQDASWEAEPERYSSLLERHSTCDAKSCRCRQGRSFHLDNTRWEIKLCVDCGSQGMHVQCGNLRVNDDWVCPVCSSVTVQKENLQTNRGSQDRLSIQNSSRRTSRRDQHVISRIATRLSQASEESGDGEDEEVDVVGSENEEEDNLREQFSGLQKSKLNDPAPQTPSPNVSIAKKSSSRSRSSKRRARSKRSRKDTVSTTQTAMEKENFEIIDIDDNSDDDVQILFTPNVKFIKTNEGVSVPVVTVPASGPSWDCGVVASGEPCQSSLSSSPTLVDVDEDTQNEDKCQPSTSQCGDTLDHHLESVNHIIVSGEPPLSDEEIEILEEPNRGPRVTILRDSLAEASTQTYLSEFCDSSETNEVLLIDDNEITEIPAFVTLHSNSDSEPYSQPVNPDIANVSVYSHSMSGVSGSVLSVIPVAAENLDPLGSAQVHVVPSHSDKGQNPTIGGNYPSSMIPLPRTVSELVSSSWLDTPSPSVASRTSTSSQIVGESVVSQSRSLLSDGKVAHLRNGNVSMAHSTVSLPPPLLPTGRHAVASPSIPILCTDPVPSLEPQVSIVCEAAPSLNQVYVSPAKSTAKSSVLNDAVNAPTDSGNTSVLCEKLKTQHSGHQNGFTVDSAPSQELVSIPHPGPDDWSYSLQIVPGSAVSAQRKEHCTQIVAEDLPEVILERNPGPVPNLSSLWSQKSTVSGFKTRQDNTETGGFNSTIVNCGFSQVTGSRERKQKLVERLGLNHVWPDNTKTGGYNATIVNCESSRVTRLRERKQKLVELHDLDQDDLESDFEVKLQFSTCDL